MQLIRRSVIISMDQDHINMIDLSIRSSNHSSHSVGINTVINSLISISLMKKKLIESLTKDQMRSVIMILRPGANVRTANRAKLEKILDNYSYNLIKDNL